MSYNVRSGRHKAVEGGTVASTVWGGDPSALKHQAECMNLPTSLGLW
eukprot:CAMPEP_0174375458 /NCGR_PEP_ID=MMETSP0811_2-20130205/114660_1 /TAXON_ID=73025 ORGANISM="Eutreptiella gymnastica-like, Strain CCMP1594" /NCGR_SAMPLE_ID=MMETSP0811_2 /ASSEMBLY_ACC=CAM_ASM_000667 /LENGTH=46 /DNA_ID= /DNA_START= /DNA_END= /DNA_ORIENTATION=